MLYAALALEEPFTSPVSSVRSALGSLSPYPACRVSQSGKAIQTRGDFSKSGHALLKRVKAGR